MKKIFLVTCIIITLIASLLIIKYTRQPQKTGTYTIGIIQTASHRALDQAREGLIEELQNKLGNKVNFVIQNAQGSIANAYTIAQHFHIDKDIRLIYAIATPAAQAIAAIEKDKPIVISAVTDTSIFEIQDNICGVNDMINLQKEVDMIIQILPNVKTIALLYNNAEANSIAQVKLIKQELNALQVNVLEVCVGQESDVPTGVAMACRKADAIICPTDNTMASTMELIASIALSNKVPLFACDNQVVNQGPLAARGVDYRSCGKEAGEIAHKILVDGEKPHNFPIINPKTDKVYVNKETLSALELMIPETLTGDVVLVSSNSNKETV